MDYRVLYHILTCEIGTPLPLSHKPLITISKRVPDRLVTELEQIGYECVRYERGSGDDDAIIQERIRNLDFTELSEIVLVTADFDFNAPLQVKRMAGVEIFWVGTETMMSPMIEVSGFTPIDLKIYAGRLVRQLHHTS